MIKALAKEVIVKSRRTESSYSVTACAHDHGVIRKN